MRAFKIREEDTNEIIASEWRAQGGGSSYYLAKVIMIGWPNDPILRMKGFSDDWWPFLKLGRKIGKREKGRIRAIMGVWV